MMITPRTGWKVLAALLVLGMAFLPIFPSTRALADDDDPPGPDRFAVLNVDVTAYEWWLIGWSDNFVACRIFIEHPGMPTDEEIYNDCGDILYTAWSETKPCDEAAEGGDVLNCHGYYIYEYRFFKTQNKVGVALPPPMVWVTLDECRYNNSTNVCDRMPSLVLTGEEPLPNESITGLTVMVDGKKHACGPICKVDLGPTGQAGMHLAFWATSSYGDTSEVFEATVRVAQTGNSDQGEETWYVDVLSSQWRGYPSAGCAQTWNLFPPVGGPPRWLATPNHANGLASNIPYDYLAGNLIIQGAVDAGKCADGGLLPSGAANTCGIEIARDAMKDWQNRFDEVIFQVAWDTGVPAQLLKNLFSRESQFWPGVFTTKADVGLGQLTENGADTTLLWNATFFEQFCPLVLDDALCRKGYAFIKEDEQQMLQGALVHSVDAVCEDCPLGIDLRQADFSIAIFAQTLLANCAQAAQVVSQVAGLPVSDVSTYEDMWRFTLVNYNAGPGCLNLALQETMDWGEPLDWGSVMQHLTPVCKGTADYIADISR